MANVWKYILFKIGDNVISKHRFQELGSIGHAKALSKARDDFENWLGSDLLDEFAEYIFLKE